MSEIKIKSIIKNFGGNSIAVDNQKLFLMVNCLLTWSFWLWKNNNIKDDCWLGDA